MRTRAYLISDHGDGGGTGLVAVGIAIARRAVVAFSRVMAPGDAELRPVQAGIEAAFGHEFVVTSNLDDAALFQHDDQVGLAERSRGGR